MPSNNNRINFQVGYNVDQSSVNAVKKSLQDLQNIKVKDFSGTKQELDDIKQVAGKVQAALTKAFNVNLNSLNTKAFNASLQEAGLSVDKIYSQFSKAGAQGQVAFSRMASEVLTTNMQLKQTNSLISSMGQTMANTVKWGIASSVMNNFTNSVQQAFNYVKNLDSALTDIRIVTGDSTEQMKEFAAQANNAAQSLGRSTMDYTKAALTFYQQGLSDEDVQARTESVLKAQNITGAGQEMADYLTAVWNGYKVANEEAELYVDKLAAVADSSASNMSQLAIAMSKVASTANAMGVDVDQLNAQIATIVATTRQAPESVGNALKTIYSRINDISTGAEGAEVSLGNYSKQMAAVGFNVLDTNGNLRDTGQVIEQIGGKWAGLSREQQIYLARTMAGQRQYNNLIALFDNWSRYSDLVNVSLDSQGTTMEKNERYMDSLAAKMEQFGAAGERVKSALINEQDLKGLVEFGTGAVNLFGNLIESIGGGRGALLTFGSIFTQVFSGTIAKELNNAIINTQNYKNNLNQINQIIQEVNQDGENSFARGISKEYVNNLKEMLAYHKALSNQQIQQQQNRAKQINSLRQQQSILKENTDQAKIFFENISGGKDLQNTSIGRINYYLSRAKQELSGLNEAYEVVLSLPIKKEGPFGDGELEQQQNALQQLAEKVRNNVELLGEGATNNDKALANIISGIAERGKVSEQVLDKLLNKIQDLQSRVNNNINNVENFGQNQKQYSELEKEAKRLQEDFNKINAGARQAFDVKAVVNFAAGLGQVASGLNNIKQLGSIWNNKDLSTGEKIFQIMTNIGMTIPMLVNGAKLIKTSWGGVTDSIKLAATQIMVRSGAIVAADAGATAAQMSLAAAIKTVTTSILSSPLAPFIALAAGVGAAIYAIYKEWNKQAEAAQKAAQVAKSTRQTYEDLKSTYEELKSSLENYNSAQEAISEMTKGTQEWRDAIRESNDAVLQLISNYPELASQVRNVNGQLILSEKGQEQALNNAASAVNTARLASVNADANSRQASLISEARNSSRLVGVDQGDYFQQATAQQVLDVAKALHGDFDKYSSDVISSNGQLVKQIAEQTNMSEDMVSAILDNVDNLDQLAVKLDENTQATKLAAQTLAAESLEGNKTYQSLDELGKKFAESLAGAGLQVNAKDFIASDEDFQQLSRISQASQEYMENILERFRDAMQDQSIDWQRNATTGIGGKQLNFLIDGQKVTYTKEQVAYTVAANQALKELGDSAKYASDILLKIDQNSDLDDNQKNAIKSFIADQDFSDYTKNQIEALKDINLQDIFNKEELESIAKVAGVTTDQLQNLFEKTANGAIDSFGKAFDSLPKVLSDKVKEGLSGKDLTLDAEKNIVENISKAVQNGGKQGYEDLLKLYNKIQDISGFDKIVSDLDLSNTSLEQLSEQLKQAGIETGLTNEQLAKYIDLVKQQQDALSPEQNYKNVHDITNNLKPGDTIDAQQAAALQEAGISLDGYFTHMADGTYKLEASAKEFNDYVNQITLQPFVDEINRASAQMMNIAKIQAEDLQNYSYEDLNQNAYSDRRRGDPLNSDLAESQLNVLQALDIQGMETDLAAWRAEFEETGSFTSATCEEMSKAIASVGEDGLEQIPERAEQLNQVIQDNFEQLRNSIPTDEDVDVDVMYALRDALMQNGQLYDQVLPSSERLSQDLQQQAWAAEDVAQGLLRYDQAIQDIQQNYENWLNILENGDIQEQAEIYDDLADSYGDLLDLDGTTLSSDFVTNADNLRLFQQAVNGSEQAYNQLLQAAGQDILAHIELENPEAFYNQLNNVQSLMDQMNWQDIQIGAVLDDSNFIAGLQNMVNAAGMTADQATSYLASMGVDAQVIENRQGTSQKKTQTGWEAHLQPVTNFGTVPMVSADENGFMTVRQMPIYTTVQSAVYTPTTETVTDTKDNAAFSLKVMSAKKSSGGGFKYKQSSHGGGTQHPSSGGGGGKKKGGGGRKGGGGSTAKPTHVATQKLSEGKKTVQDKSDPYHDINIQLDKQDKKLKKIQNQQKKLTGAKRLANLKQQNKELEKQSGLYEDKIAVANHQLITTRNQLIADLGNGIKFDKNGQISNYNKALDTALNNYNRAIQQYNNSVRDAENQYNSYVAYYNSLSKEQQDNNKIALEQQKDAMDSAKKAAQDTLDAEKEKYDRIKDNIKGYQDTRDLIQDLLESQEGNLEKIRENLIAISQIKVDLSLDAGDLERDWIDFENKFIKKIDKDDLFAGAKADARQLMSYFDSKQLKNTTEQIGNITKQIQIMRNGGKSTIYGDDLASAQARLNELLKQQMKSLEDIQGLVDDIADKYLDALDDAKDKMDDQIDQFERVNDIIDHNVKLTQLLYGDKAYGTMQKYYNLQKDNNERELQSLRSQQDYWQRVMNSFVNSNGEIINKEAFDKAKKNLDDLTDQLNSKLEDMIQNLSKQWENRVDGIIAKLNNAMTGGRGLDYLDEQWDYINDFDDNFLDTFESKMGIQQVQNLYQQAIDGLNGSPANQQKMNKLMNDQLKILREKDNLTQYDIDRAKAALQVQKARMALEDSRYNKTKMRLRRDSQGNYTYQYVADEEKLTDLQASLAEAQANLYNMDKEHYTENLNKINDVWREYLEKRGELAREAANTEDEEERKRIEARINLLSEAKNKLMEGLTEDNKYAYEYIGNSFFGGMGIDQSLYTLEQQAEIMTQNIPQMSSNIQDLANNIVDEGGLLNATAGAMKQIGKVTQDYDNEVRQFLNNAGTNLQVVSQVTDAFGNALDSNIQQAQNLLPYYTDLINTSVNAITSIKQVMDEVNKSLSGLISDADLEKLGQAYNILQKLNEVGTKFLGDGGKTGGKSLLKGDDLISASARQWGLDSANPEAYNTLLEANSKIDTNLLSSSKNILDSVSNMDLSNLSDVDTESVSKVLEYLTHSMNSIADSQIAAITSEASGYIGNISNVEHLDQNVHIEANFPNVTQHTEIEQAFNNLINIASMRASKYNN